MTRIIRLEPHSMAIFWKVDVDPGFAMKLCNDVSLFDAVHGTMFVGPQDAESRVEVAGIVERLRESGNIEFEDGWIMLRSGLANITGFLMDQIVEAREDERDADKQRFEELRRREAAEEKYALLRQALVEALGDNGAVLAVTVAA
jgi:hypothetical protein